MFTAFENEFPDEDLYLVPKMTLSDNLPEEEGKNKKLTELIENFGIKTSPCLTGKCFDIDKCMHLLQTDNYKLLCNSVKRMTLFNQSVNRAVRVSAAMEHNKLLRAWRRSTVDKDTSSLPGSLFKSVSKISNWNEVKSYFDPIEDLSSVIETIPKRFLDENASLQKLGELVDEIDDTKSEDLDNLMESVFGEEADDLNKQKLLSNLRKKRIGNEFDREGNLIDEVVTLIKERKQKEMVKEWPGMSSLAEPTERKNDREDSKWFIYDNTEYADDQVPKEIQFIRQYHIDSVICKALENKLGKNAMWKNITHGHDGHCLLDYEKSMMSLFPYTLPQCILKPRTHSVIPFWMRSRYEPARNIQVGEKAVEAEDTLVPYAALDRHANDDDEYFTKVMKKKSVKKHINEEPSIQRDFASELVQRINLIYKDRLRYEPKKVNVNKELQNIYDPLTAKDVFSSDIALKSEVDCSPDPEKPECLEKRMRNESLLESLFDCLFNDDICSSIRFKRQQEIKNKDKNERSCIRPIHDIGKIRSSIEMDTESLSEYSQGFECIFSDIDDYFTETPEEKKMLYKDVSAVFDAFDPYRDEDYKKRQVETMLQHIDDDLIDEILDVIEHEPYVHHKTAPVLEHIRYEKNAPFDCCADLVKFNEETLKDSPDILNQWDLSSLTERETYVLTILGLVIPSGDRRKTTALPIDSRPRAMPEAASDVVARPLNESRISSSLSEGISGQSDVVLPTESMSETIMKNVYSKVIDKISELNEVEESRTRILREISETEETPETNAVRSDNIRSDKDREKESPIPDDENSPGVSSATINDLIAELTDGEFDRLVDEMPDKLDVEALTSRGTEFDSQDLLGPPEEDERSYDDVSIDDEFLTDSFSDTASEVEVKHAEEPNDGSQSKGVASAKRSKTDGIFR